MTPMMSAAFETLTKEDQQRVIREFENCRYVLLDELPCDILIRVFELIHELGIVPHCNLLTKEERYDKMVPLVAELKNIYQDVLGKLESTDVRAFLKI